MTAFDANAGKTGKEASDSSALASLLSDPAKDWLGEKSVFDQMAAEQAAQRQQTDAQQSAQGNLPNNREALLATCVAAQQAGNPTHEQAWNNVESRINS